MGCPTACQAIAASLLILAAPATSFAENQSTAAGDPGLEAALARPLTPAAVVLLLHSASQPKVVERLALALRDRNPAVRAAAARRPESASSHVAPVYPKAMQDQRIQGVVIIEATIATTGCVSDATVLRSVHPTIDVATLAAVSLWLYEPTLLNGAPIPVIMTVTVNFTLR
jgi:TonB family protein